MKKLVLIILISLLQHLAYSVNLTLENPEYRLSYDTDAFSFTLLRQGSSAQITYQSTVKVLRHYIGPVCSLQVIDQDFNGKSVEWTSGSATNDMFSVPNVEVYFPDIQSVEKSGDTIVIIFSDVYKESALLFSTTAKLYLPENGEAVFALNFKNKHTSFAHYSMAFDGVPARSLNAVSEIFQPLMWTEMRFPNKAYLTPAFLASLPGTFATSEGTTYGVLADPAELPFNPMPISLARSPFGVAIRNGDGMVQPSVWAPILGGTNSRINSEGAFDFSYRLFVSDEDLSHSYEDVSRRLFGFSNYRHNALGALNEAFENMVKYGKSEYSRFNEEMKGNSYDTDVAGAVKNTSFLSPYNIAYVVDDDEIFDTRAIPMMEFMMSRTNTMYADDQTSGAGGQTATNTLDDGCAPASEAASAYNIAPHTTFFLDYTKKSAVGSSDLAYESALQKNFSLYKATGEKEYYDDMISGANDYLEDRIVTKQTDFNYLYQKKSSFWCQIAPKFVELFEIYKLTGFQKYLLGAQEAARRYAFHIWMAPAVNLTDSVLCNIGNKAPNYRSGSPIAIPEENAPVWRLSEQGLHCEAGGTSTSGHRGLFLNNWAPVMLRIGALTDDDFLSDIAKAAVIGRYRNFPGYHVNTDRTTVYEKENFPLRTHAQLNTTTSMHYSHIWPMISMVMDYLVSDVAARSRGAIDFPSQYVQNIVFLQNQIYFDGGEFYGDKDLSLWMPLGLVDCNEKEVNYIVARGNGKLYLAFTNQSSNSVTADITLNSDLVSLGNNPVKIWEDNLSTTQSIISNNSFSIDVSAHGITAVAIENVEIHSLFQNKLLCNTKANNWLNIDEELVNVDCKVKLFNLSDSISHLFAYSEAPKGDYSQVVFRLKYNGIAQTPITDISYPFEISERIPHYANMVEVSIETGNSTATVLLERAKSVSGELSGWTTIKKGLSSPLRFKLEGVAPFNVKYSDGSTVYNINNIPTNIHSEMVSPLRSTIYNMLEITDASDEIGEIRGKAKVLVLDDFENIDSRLDVNKDSYVNQASGRNNYSEETVLTIGGKENEQKVAYLGFDISDFTVVDKVYLRLYLSQAPDTTVLLTVAGANSPNWFEEDLSWYEVPQFVEDDINIDTIGISEISPDSSYYYLDVTDFVKFANTNNITFRLMALNDKSLTFNSREAIANKPQLITMSTIANTQWSRTSVFNIYPTITDGIVTVVSAQDVEQVVVLNSQGMVVYERYDFANQINLSRYTAGQYFIKVKTGNEIVIKSIIKR